MIDDFTTDMRSLRARFVSPAAMLRREILFRRPAMGLELLTPALIDDIKRRRTVRFLTAGSQCCHDTRLEEPACRTQPATALSLAESASKNDKQSRPGSVMSATECNASGAGSASHPQYMSGGASRSAATAVKATGLSREIGVRAKFFAGEFHSDPIPV